MVDLALIPYLTTQQMIEVDRLMVDVYGIQLIQMMENAGRHLAVLARDRFLGGSVDQKQIVVLAGSGGNGGGALVAARNLHNWGARIEVILTRPMSELSGVVQTQAKILQALGVDLLQDPEVVEQVSAELIIDGIIGYNLRGAPRGAAANMINWANQCDVAVLSLDVPSGLDAGTGEVHSPVVRAAATLTLALPKIGLKQGQADVIGELYLADIGVPPELYAHPALGLAVSPIFHTAQIIRLK
jgi:NAD(P)H-hydrate epimerase